MKKKKCKQNPGLWKGVLSLSFQLAVGGSCGLSILRSHILKHAICSGAVQVRVCCADDGDGDGDVDGDIILKVDFKG